MAAPSKLLGDKTVEPIQDGGIGTSEAFGYTASASGTATGIKVYLASTDGVSVGLYSDSSGRPGALLGSGTVSSNASGWVEVSLSKGVQINLDTRYWLAIAAKNSSATVSYYDDGSSGSQLDYSGNGLGNPFSINAQWHSNPATVYLTGRAAPPTAPSNTGPPEIWGTPQKGAKLTATHGTWTGTAPITYSYHWQENRRNISGATSQTYVPTKRDVGNKIDVVVTAKNKAGPASATSAATTAVQKSGSAGMYALPADRTYDWNPGLNAVGGIPHRTTIYKTISPSGGDDTATIQAALDSCPKNEVVQLTAGVFHISGQGLSIERSYCTLRGTGPGPGNFTPGQPPAGGTTTGTYLVKPVGTGYPVVIIGPRWGGTGRSVYLTSNAVRGADSVMVASTSGLAPGDLVRLDELTDPNISHWNSQDPENNSGWFEDPNRPLGETMEIASISGHRITFTTTIPITYLVSQSAYLAPLQNVVRYSGVEDLYAYGGEGGDGGGGIHLFSCAYCWVKHVEDTWTNGSAVALDNGFRDVVRDSYIHNSSAGLYSGGASYGISVNWYTSDSLFENNIIMDFDKVDVMRSAGGGNVFGYNYMDDGADLGGEWEEDLLTASHGTTPHYELFEGNEAPNFDEDDRWGNSVYITVFRNDLTGANRDFPQYGPWRAAGLTQWHWWQSFVGNVLGTPSDVSDFNEYESIGGSWNAAIWLLCYQAADDVPDGGKCLHTQLRAGNYDYLTKKVHWYGIGGTGVNNGLRRPADSTLPASLYLSSKPAFFGSNPWPWVDGANAADPLPGQLPARERYDAGTPNAVN